MLKGIAASAGIAIAKVYKLETPSFEIVKTEATPAEEVAKFNAALEKTKSDIEGIKERAAKRLAPEELAVFDAHLMMAGLSDSALAPAPKEIRDQLRASIFKNMLLVLNV